jgi:hypothetical protein
VNLTHLTYISNDRLPTPAAEITTKEGCQQFEGDQAKKCEIAVKAGVTVIIDS